jgi:hypothetical protein
MGVKMAKPIAEQLNEGVPAGCFLTRDAKEYEDRERLLPPNEGLQPCAGTGRIAHADILGTRMPSPEDTGTGGRDAAIEELTVINVARAPARFRAFPDDAGIAL